MQRASAVSSPFAKIFEVYRRIFELADSASVGVRSRWKQLSQMLSRRKQKAAASDRDERTEIARVLSSGLRVVAGPEDGDPLEGSGEFARLDDLATQTSKSLKFERRLDKLEQEAGVPFVGIVYLFGLFALFASDSLVAAALLFMFAGAFLALGLSYIANWLQGFSIVTLYLVLPAVGSLLMINRGIEFDPRRTRFEWSSFSFYWPAAAFFSVIALVALSLLVAISRRLVLAVRTAIWARRDPLASSAALLLLSAHQLENETVFADEKARSSFDRRLELAQRVVRAEPSKLEPVQFDVSFARSEVGKFTSELIGSCRRRVLTGGIASRAEVQPLLLHVARALIVGDYGDLREAKRPARKRLSAKSSVLTRIRSLLAGASPLAILLILPRLGIAVDQSWYSALTTAAIAILAAYLLFIIDPQVGEKIGIARELVDLVKARDGSESKDDSGASSKSRRGAPE